MSTNFNTKPVGAPAAQSANSAVAAELPASESVTAAADPIAYRVADNRTSLVVQPFSDESILRRRAYFRALDLTRRAPTRLVVTDRTV